MLSNISKNKFEINYDLENMGNERRPINPQPRKPNVYSTEETKSESFDLEWAVLKSVLKVLLPGL